MPITVSMTVNGKAVTGEIEPRTLLVQFIRENLKLTAFVRSCVLDMLNFHKIVGKFRM